MSATGLKGRLLVALPVLIDPNFDRTVVYLLEHGNEGALGLVLNRPSPLALAEPLPRWSLLAADPEVIFVGGPVASSSAIGLGERGEGTVEVVDLEEAPDAFGQPVDRVRVFAGHAGWTSGQLENEIDAGAWVVVDTEPGDVMTDDPEGLWTDVLRRQRGALAALANFPLDATLN